MNFVWAFSPFDRNKELDKKAVALFASILGARKKLEVVFVASPNCAELSTAFDVPEEDRFTQYPEELMQTSMKKLRIKPNKYTVLVEQSLSLTQSVKALATYLTRSKATLAIVASRARTGLSRLVMGSFAESLVHFSGVDLLIFNENSTVNKRPPRSLLFAHDYSKSADKGLERAIDYAKTWGCLLHVIHIPEPVYAFKFSGLETDVESYRKRVNQKLRRIEEKVKEAGVFGSVEIDSRLSAVADRILKRASSVSADFILVVAKSGKLASLLGGSVTRQILRTARVPVLVVKRL